MVFCRENNRSHQNNGIPYTILEMLRMCTGGRLFLSDLLHHFSPWDVEHRFVVSIILGLRILFLNHL